MWSDNIEESVRQYQEAAEQGYAEAQYELGVRYLLGVGGAEENTEKAVKWLQKAVEQGDLHARIVLGICYCNGVGVEKDIELGHRYLNENGVEENRGKPIKQLRKAAKRGYAEAQYELGVRYLLGVGGAEENTEKAVKWLQKAVEQGDLHARTVLGICYCNGVGVEKDIELGHRYLYDDGRDTLSGETVTEFIGIVLDEAMKKHSSNWGSAIYLTLEELKKIPKKQ